MLTCFKPSYPFNKTIGDYCRKSTNKSIQKFTEKYNLERNKPKFINPFNEDENNPKFNIYAFLTFLSISTISFFFYKRVK